VGGRSRLLGWVGARGWQRRPAEQRQNDQGESLPPLPPSRRRKCQEAQVGEKNTPRMDGAEEGMTQTAARKRRSRQVDDAQL